MGYSISAFAWTRQFERRHLGVLSEVRELGYEAFEVPMFAPSDLPVRALREALRANGLRCTVCAILPSGINPISPDAGARRAARAHLLAAIETAAEMGATLLGGPVLAPIGYTTGARASAEEWAWAAECCHGLTDALEQHGMLLALEPVNRAETHLLRTAEEALTLWEQVRHARIGVTIDTFHANIEEKDVVRAVQMLGERLFHLHLSENDRGVLGSGHVPFAEVLGAVGAGGLAGFLTVEGFAFDAEERLAPGFLLAARETSPREFARESLRYLQSIAGAAAPGGRRS